MNMTGYDERLAAASKGETKTHVNGICASNDPARLVEVLERLDLCSPELGVPLKTIAAAGGELKEFLQVNVYKLDQALKRTEATIEQRLAFKASLSRFGLLVVPK
jgi:hypothetical protein